MVIVFEVLLHIIRKKKWDCKPLPGDIRMNRETLSRLTAFLLQYTRRYGHMSLVPLARDHIIKYQTPLSPLLSAKPEADEDHCPVCLCEWEKEETGVRPATCTHVFHAVCVQPWLEEHHSCPVCRTPTQVTRGYQPYHRWAYCHNQYHARALPLYPQHGSHHLVIFVPKQDNHSGYATELFLPDNIEGRDLVRLLKTAFERQLLLRQEGERLVPNGIELKRFPDQTFLARLRADLSDAGVE